MENRDHKSVSIAGSNASTSVRKSDVGSNKSNNQHNLGSNAASNVGQNQGKKLPRTVESMMNGVMLSSYEALPSFMDAPSSEKQSLFMRKLRMCCVLFDFHDPTKNLREKEIKRQTLLEIVDYISADDGKFSENVMQNGICKLI